MIFSIETKEMTHLEAGMEMTLFTEEIAMTSFVVAEVRNFIWNSGQNAFSNAAD